MNWYFEEHGVIKGPFPEGDFAEMVRRRDVPADALVWRPGLEEWATAQEINPPWLKNIASGLQPARPQQGPGAPKDQPSNAPKQQVSAPAKEQVSSPPKDQVAAAPKLQVSAPTKEQVSNPPKDPVPTVTKLQVSAPTREPASTPPKDETPGASKEQANNGAKPSTTPAKESLPVIEGAIPNQAAASTPARTTVQAKFKPMAPIPSEGQNQPTEKGGLLKRVFGIGGKQKS